MVDYILENKYKLIFGMNNIENFSNNTILKGDSTVLSSIYSLGENLLYGSTTMLSNINISNTSVFNNMIINSMYNINTYINNSVNFQNNTNCNNKYVKFNVISNNCTTLYNKTIYSSLFISGITRIYNNIITSNIGNTNTTNIYGNTIYIGNINSTIKIIGTSTYVGIKNLNINDKIYSLNINGSTTAAFDTGNNSGIEILGTNTTGFIKSSNDSMFYQLKGPSNINTENILTVLNDNLYITGTNIFQSFTTFNSSLYISNKSYFNYVSNNSTCNINNNFFTNNLTIFSNLSISNNSTLINCNTINILCNNNYTTLNISINSNFISNNVSSRNIFNMVTNLSNIYINQNSLLKNVTILNFLNITGYNIINGSCTCNNILNSNNNIIVNTTTLLSSINISNNGYFNNLSTINSSLFVNNTTNINGDITIGSVTKNLNILSTIISKIPEYNNNAEAKVGGLPLYGFYRTGGIMKIRLDDVAPVLTLVGNSTVTISGNYTDPGVTATDNFDTNITVYVSSIKNNNIELLTTPILISNIGSYLSYANETSYIVKYTASDSDGNQAMPIYRTINISTTLIFTRPAVTGMSNLFSNNKINGLIGATYINGSYMVWPCENGSIDNTSCKLYTSTNRINWTYNSYLVNNIPNGRTIMHAASSLTATILIIAETSSKWNIYRSTNTYATWSLVYSSNQSLYTAYYFNGNFIILGSVVLMSTTDGLTWTVILTDTYYLAMYGNNIYILVNGDTYIRSADNCVTWTTHKFSNYIALLANVGLSAGGYANGRFIVTRYSTSSSKGLYYIHSTDGLSWTLSELPYYNGINAGGSSNCYYIHAVIKLGSKVYVIIILRNDPTYGTVTYIVASQDCISWSINTTISIPSNTFADFGRLAALSNNTLIIPLYANSFSNQALTDLSTNGSLSPMLIV